MEDEWSKWVDLKLAVARLRPQPWQTQEWIAMQCSLYKKADEGRKSGCLPFHNYYNYWLDQEE